MNATTRRASYVFLCALPFLDVVLIGARPLRTPGVFQTVGVVVALLCAIAAWNVGVAALASGAGAARGRALAGTLLVAPWLIMSLLWIGVGAPFQATLAENYMRFKVLVTDLVLVSGGFLALNAALAEAGERLFSTLGFAASITAGAAYLFCVSMSLAKCGAMMRGDQYSAPPILGDLYGVLEFVACAATSLATAAFALSLAEAQWLGRGASRVYVALCLICLVLLVMRGISYPEISARTAPWFTQPGVIVGIPAVPWIMPGLLGVVVLRRAGEGP